MLECWFSEKTPIGIGYDLVKTKFQSESKKERNRIRSGENQIPIRIEKGTESDTIWWKSNSNRKRNGIGYDLVTVKLQSESKTERNWIRSGDNQIPIGIENGMEFGYDLVTVKLQSESKTERNWIRSGDNQIPIEIRNGTESESGNNLLQSCWDWVTNHV